MITTLGVSKMASNIACILESGRHPILIDVLVQCVKYVLRLFMVPANSLLGLALMEHIVANQNKQSAPLLVCTKILNQAGYEFKKIDKTKLSTHKINSIGQKVRKSLVALFNKHAFEKINKVSKLEFYSLIKKSARMEPYLDWIKNAGFGSVMTKFRISDHLLQ